MANNVPYRNDTVKRIVGIDLTQPYIDEDNLKMLSESWIRSSFIILDGGLIMESGSDACSVFSDNLDFILDLRDRLREIFTDGIDVGSVKYLAKEFKEIEADRDKLLTEITSMKLNNAMQTQSNLDKNKNDEGLVRLSNELESIKRELESKQGKEAIYKTSIKELQQQCNLLTAENERLNVQLQQLQVHVQQQTKQQRETPEYTVTSLESLQKQISTLESEKSRLEADLKAAELKVFFLEINKAPPSTPPRRQGKTSADPGSGSSEDAISFSSAGSQPSSPPQIQRQMQQQLRQRELEERVQFLQRQLEELSKKSEERMHVLRNENVQVISDLRAKSARLAVEKGELEKALDEARSQNTGLREELSGSRAEKATALAALSAAEARLREAEGRALVAQRGAEEAAGSYRTLAATVEELNGQLQNLTAERDDWRQRAENSSAPETTTPTSESGGGNGSDEDAMNTLLQKYERLKTRVEELKNERDSYREAMMKVFEEANPANGPATPGGVSSSGSGKHPGRLPQGVGSDRGDPPPNSKNVTALSGFMNSNKQLQDQLADLTRQNNELKQLERLRPQLMELQQRIAVMQEENFKNRVKYVEETAALTESNQELQLQLKACNRQIDLMTIDLHEAKAFADTLSKRLEEYLAREQALRAELEVERRKNEDLVAKAVDPLKIVELENQIAEAVGERKHWQSKAQSLSKDMQRMMGLAADLVQLKEENERVQHRLEEVETEKSAFKQAMQKAMAEKNPPPNSSPQNATIVPFSWF